ncbi:alanine racemase [Rhizocola hellebori]|nr:alanine racemase [Rhizocola hellebori]
MRVECVGKGFWQPKREVSFVEFVQEGHNLFGGAFTWPIMVLRRSALDHNLATLAAFCREYGFEFAPHGKTTMSPTLWQMQLDAGAWGITLATVNQALVAAKFGVPRVLLANEVLDPGPLRWLATQEGFDFSCFVDSLAGVRVLEQVGRPVSVFAELGFAGGRAGCRSANELVQVVRAAKESGNVTVKGVAGYEGGLPDARAVAAYVDSLKQAALTLAAEGLLEEEVIVTAGGSTYFDVVADGLAGQWLPGHRLKVVLRSGAYLSHDDGFYLEHTPFLRVPEKGSLKAAIELWAQVTSTPEEGLVIAGMGKRDAPHDEGLPVPLRIRGLDGKVRNVSGAEVVRLNDHHAYVTGVQASAGELICFGISHPCTAFDKWRVIPVVEDDYRVSDLLRTYF